jgi:hypothetical protein
MTEPYSMGFSWSLIWGGDAIVEEDLVEAASGGELIKIEYGSSGRIGWTD